MAAMTWQTERAVAEQAAQAAGRILLDWAGKFTVRYKGVNDLVTEADRAAQEAIQKHLLRAFPNDGFLGEEQGGNLVAKEGTSGRRWIVDPLDGTTNFVHSLPIYAVSIGLEVEGQLTVGVIYDPTRRECFSAAKGGGVTCNGVPGRCSTPTRLADAMISAGLPIELSQNSLAQESTRQVMLRSRSIRRLGSAALSLAYVSVGRLDGYYGFTVNAWDVAAGVVMVREAGGLVTNFDQQAYSHEDPHILASNGLFHQELAGLFHG